MKGTHTIMHHDLVAPEENSRAETDMSLVEVGIKHNRNFTQPSMLFSTYRTHYNMPG